ncbi:MAG: DUF6152 family protein [Gammaproteobacteria bacterium]|nr:DUF6152 family protein [Gammaproteobacteria bacterium]MDH3508504.1 DUF6152 family protein [Gammaproteobacteria bacterium]
MRISLIAFVAGSALAASAVQVSAHHAFAAEFDVNRPITLTGTVVELELINPHSWIHLDVTSADGTIERWMIEGGPPNALFRRGFTRAALPIGSEIVVEGFQAKDGSMRANGRDIVFTDGRTPFTGSFGVGPDSR